MIRVVGILGLITAMIMIGMTLMIGDEVKGATAGFH